MRLSRLRSLRNRIGLVAVVAAGVLVGVLYASADGTPGSMARGILWFAAIPVLYRLLDAADAGALLHASSWARSSPPWA